MKEVVQTLDYEGEHAAVLERAMQLFRDKSQIRGQLWMEFPPSDKIRELNERMRRIEYAYSRGEYDAVVEDALDVINFAAFLVKQIERGQSG